MTHEGEGFIRPPEQLSGLTLDGILPLDVNELADTRTSNELYGLAAEQQGKADILRKQLEQLEDQAASLRVDIDKANADRDAYLEAHVIARAAEDGK